MINDYEVAEWEESQAELTLYVCSTCGLISDEIIEHGEDCALSDNWVLHVVCMKKQDDCSCKGCKGNNNGRNSN